MKKLNLLRPMLGSILLLSAASTALDATAAENEQEVIKRGEYLSRAGDCIACHTEEHGGKSYAGGYEFPMPMGKIISSNITPSKVFGIGNYSEADFSRAVREGVAPDGTRLYPAMPYTEYSKITDEDIHALYVYFMKGVSPIDEPPAVKTVLTFPFNLPGVMRVWNALFLDTKTFKPDLSVSAEVNRGHYLVDGLAHCTSCHTPRNSMLAVDNSKYLEGATVGGWYAPNLTSDSISGIGGWTNQELVQYLRTGHVEGKAQAGGGMAEAVQNSFQHMSEADLQAIASYLKTVKPVRNAQQHSPAYSVDKAKTTDWENYEFSIDNNAAPARHDNLSNLSGASLYNSACAACHGMNGEGTPDQVIPSLTRNSAVGAELANNVVMAISQGIHRESQGKMASMPAFSVQAEHITSSLSPAQIASVTNYVMAQYGKRNPELTEKDVLQIQQGGGSSFLIRYAALLAWAGFSVGAIILLVALIFMVKFRRKKR